jgi:uncharacterized protein (TIGR02145 family)
MMAYLYKTISELCPHSNSYPVTMTVCLAATVLIIFGGWGCAGGESGSFIDPRDGQTYRTVKIGDLTWMAENLNYVMDSSWCYDDADSNCVKYGRLYKWEASMSACSTMGEGWRLPDKHDWAKLEKNAGGASVVGKRLKSRSGWGLENNRNGTDKFGFSALPGGYRFADKDFLGITAEGHWWVGGQQDKTNYFIGWEGIFDRTDYFICRAMTAADGQLWYTRIHANAAVAIRCVRE